MPLALAQLLAVSVYRAFDIDADGRILAGTDVSGSVQLAEISPDGRLTPLTRLAGACTGRYLPGQRAVIVSHDDGGNERQQLSLLRLPLPDSRPADLDSLVPLVADPRFIHTLSDVRAGRICYLTNRRDGVAFDAVIRNLADDSERTIIIGDRAIDEATVSPDGRWLALSAPSPALANSAQVLLVDLGPDGGAVTEVTPAGELAMNGGLHWLPGSDALVTTSNHDREFTAIARYDLASASRTWLVTDDASDLAGWLSPDGQHLLVERNDDGASVLAVHEAATGRRLRDVPLPAGGCVTGARLPEPRWSPDSRAIALSVSAAELPGDILLAPAGPGTPRQLTSSAAVLGGAPMARPEPHQIPAAGGELVPCLVYRSADPADPGLSGSAVVVVHGGPEAQAKRGFDPYVQALAAAGHTVVVPNVRGSVGYGKRWYSADDGPRRMDAVADLAAIHGYLPKLAVDPDRAALWGASYGGYMVLAGLAFQPGLWAAGVDIVGISSLVTFLENTSAYRRAYREREYGTLARDREFLHAASPLTRIDQIRAPLFIIHGANDPRVPLSEAEQIHAALAGRGQECELLVYGDEGHGLAQRANRTDAVPRAVAFLARHLAG